MHAYNPSTWKLRQEDGAFQASLETCLKYTKQKKMLLLVDIGLAWAL
jgi:hypothetical protein